MGPGFESLKVHQQAEPAPRIGSRQQKLEVHTTMVELSANLSRSEVSDINAEGPPVPIPNTEVKLCSAENTCLATDRENRSMLTYNRQTAKVMPVKDSCSDNCRGKESVILTQRVHPFPFRTRKLSSAVPKILIWRRIGKIGHCRHIIRETEYVSLVIFNLNIPP